MDELRDEVGKSLRIRVTSSQMQSTAALFAEQGLFEGTKESSRDYRIFDATKLAHSLSRLVPILTTRWFAIVTLGAFLACLALLVVDWSRFVDAASRAARTHPLLSVLLYYVTFIPVALLHELGHAIVVRHSGGEVPEVVIRSNAHFAVLTNKWVIKDRTRQMWYLSMGTVVDVFIWLGLLIAFHYADSYVVTMFLLPQSMYFLLYSYSIFNNSDFLKVIAIWLAQPVPANPWEFVRDSWRKPPESAGAQKLAHLMTAALAVKVAITTLLIATFLIKDYLVLVLYAVYKLVVYLFGNRVKLLKRLSSMVPRLIRV